MEYIPLLIGFASFAFLVPYAMAVWMNNFHHKYYKTMCNAYTNLRISGCKNSIYNVDSIVSTIQDEARKPFYGTLKPDTCPKSPEDAEKLYSKYITKAMERKITKRRNFNFNSFHFWDGNSLGTHLPY